LTALPLSPGAVEFDGDVAQALRSLVDLAPLNQHRSLAAFKKSCVMVAKKICHESTQVLVCWASVI
jgi:hypothetical protein